MQFYFLTRDELRARGWVGPGTLDHPSVSACIPTEMQDQLCGTTIEVDPFVGSVQVERSDGCGRWTVTPEMLRCVKIKTRDELIADGWQTSSRALDLEPPTEDHAYRLPEEASAYENLGKWVPMTRDLPASQTECIRAPHYLCLMRCMLAHEQWATIEPQLEALPAPGGPMLFVFKSRRERDLAGLTATHGLPISEMNGRLLELTLGEDRSREGQTMSWRRAGEGATYWIPVAYLHAARVKSRRELLDSGWSVSGNDLFKNGWRFTSQHLSALGGQWVPTHKRYRDLVEVPGARLHLDVFATAVCAVPEYTPLAAAGTPARATTAAAPARSPARATIKAFRDADLATAMTMVTCGFELETQATMGLDRNSAGEPDEAAFAAAVESGVTSLTRGLRDYITSDALAAVQAAARAGLPPKMNKRDYTRPPRTTIKEKCPESVEVVEDGSVAGFELRTRGPQESTAFLSASEAVFGLPHRIDHACSFHIHVAVKGLEHKYGSNMQAALTDFLIQHIDEVPESVRARWTKKEWRSQYFPPILADQKYSFVSKHRAHGTWEFRCFGNVTNQADATKCLELAVRAMQHGYAVLTGKASLFMTQLRGPSEWANLCASALDAGINLDAALEANQAYAAAG